MKHVYTSLLAACLCVLAGACESKENSPLTLSDEAIKLFRERLFNAKSLRCELGPGYAGAWQNGVFKINKDEWSKNAAIVFDSIDLAKGTARMVGNIGAGDVNVIATAAGLTFIEKTGGGWMTMMTVFSSPLSNDGKFVCAYSRHSAFGDGSISSQYHGTCKILSP